MRKRGCATRTRTRASFILHSGPPAFLTQGWGSTYQAWQQPTQQVPSKFLQEVTGLKCSPSPSASRPRMPLPREVREPPGAAAGFCVGGTGLQLGRDTGWLSWPTFPDLSFSCSVEGAVCCPWSLLPTALLPPLCSPGRSPLAACPSHSPPLATGGPSPLLSSTVLERGSFCLLNFSESTCKRIISAEWHLREK